MVVAVTTTPRQHQVGQEAKVVVVREVPRRLLSALQPRYRPVMVRTARTGLVEVAVRLDIACLTVRVLAELAARASWSCDTRCPWLRNRTLPTLPTMDRRPLTISRRLQLSRSRDRLRLALSCNFQRLRKERVRRVEHGPTPARHARRVRRLVSGLARPARCQPGSTRCELLPLPI